MAQNDRQASDSNIPIAPKGLGILLVVGPSLVWAAEYIGSGEVIIATRTGAILGTTVLWAVILGVFLKFWIGVAGARYTVCTGEGMIDMFDRIPGPRHWVVWIVLVVQLFCAVMSTGALATSAGTFIHSLVPAVDVRLCGLFAALFAVAVAWSGVFDVLKIVMSLFVLIIVIGAMYIAYHVFPSFGELAAGLTGKLPAVPEWAVAMETVDDSAWQEILPVLGWGAGGFASQVWYTYWVIGAGYGATAGRGYGRTADLSSLRAMPKETAQRIKGWCYTLYVDSSLAMVLGILVTGAFLIAGAGILGVEHLVPENSNMADVLAEIFARRWDNVGGFLFKLCGAVAMVSTLMGQLAGWPRLLADSCRLCIPGFNRKFVWKWQFRIFLILFAGTSLLIVCVLGRQPISMLKISSILEGVLLIALQAAAVGIGLFFIMPRMLSKEAYAVLKPGWIFAAGLLGTFAFYGYLCVTQVPQALLEILHLTH
ncbi:MAG: Nramp family divalent metal transporter [Phycisphaerales bacterium]|nr:MAG: Nramp family divalent metal transporter [Phycisphaerales bacterium]